MRYEMTYICIYLQKSLEENVSRWTELSCIGYVFDDQVLHLFVSCFLIVDKKNG